jgi:hypothetical protein
MRRTESRIRRENSDKFECSAYVNYCRKTRDLDLREVGVPDLDGQSDNTE